MKVVCSQVLMSVCVIGSTIIIKNGDKTLVERRSEFNAEEEILSPDFSVNISNSVYVCKACLSKLNKTRALISNLRFIPARRMIHIPNRLMQMRQQKTCVRTLFESDVQPTKCFVLQDGWSLERPQAFGIILFMTSTPNRERCEQESTDAPWFARKYMWGYLPRDTRRGRSKM